MEHEDPQKQATGPEQGVSSSRAEPIQLRVQLPTLHEGEIRFANLLAASFDGNQFILTIAQFATPIVKSQEEFIEIASAGPVPARIMDQFAVPVERFVEAVDSFAAVIARLREEGVVQPRQGGQQ